MESRKVGDVTVLVDGPFEMPTGADAIGGAGRGNTLAILEGRCLGIGSGDEAMVVLWPHTATVESSDGRLLLANEGDRVVVGEKIYLDDRPTPLSKAEQDEMNAALPLECRSYQKLAVMGFAKGG